jgi:hypothetical protein
MKTRLFIVDLDDRITYVGGTVNTVLPKIKSVILEYIEEAGFCVSKNFAPNHMQDYTGTERFKMIAISHLDTWQYRELITELRDLNELAECAIFEGRLTITEHYLR